MSGWLVVGASGFIGAALADRLKIRGIAVSAVHAPRLRVSPAASAAEVLAAAAGNAHLDGLVDQLRGHAVVVNAAGVSDSGAEPTPELFGANALLPVVIAVAAERAGVPRVLHVSSAAVQGRTAVLDASRQVAPFSPYSQSKALAEEALWLHQDRLAAVGVGELTILRATSVQGEDRATTSLLALVARSPLASVAAPGDQPTPVTTVTGLTSLIVDLGSRESRCPRIVLQPWTGATVTSVLVAAGGRNPRRLPRRLCSAALGVLWPLVRVLGPRWTSRVRQLELMWFGQRQADDDDPGGG